MIAFYITISIVLAITSVYLLWQWWTRQLDPKRPLSDEWREPKQ